MQIEWKKLKGNRPDIDQRILVKLGNKYFVGNFSGFSKIPDDMGSNIIGVNKGMPVFHDGEYVEFTQHNSPKIAVTDETQYICVTN